MFITLISNEWEVTHTETGSNNNGRDEPVERDVTGMRTSNPAAENGRCRVPWTSRANSYEEAWT
jgi:hypothetical protein